MAVTSYVAPSRGQHKISNDVSKTEYRVNAKHDDVTEAYGVDMYRSLDRENDVPLLQYSLSEHIVQSGCDKFLCCITVLFVHVSVVDILDSWTQCGQVRSTGYQ